MTLPTLPRRLANALLILGALGTLGGGAMLGMAFGERASRPGHRELVIADPRLATAGGGVVLRSPGGFTGFDGPGSLGGAAVRVGTVGASRGGAFEVISDGSSLGIRATDTSRLFLLRRASSALASGDAVVVRVGADGNASAVLRVPRDLNEGAGRPSATPTPTATATGGTGAAAPVKATSTPTSAR